MSILSQIFSPEFEVSDGVFTIKIKRQLTDSEFNDLSILCFYDLERFLENEKLQKNLEKYFDLIETIKIDGEMFEVFSFVDKRIALNNFYSIIYNQIKDLKKK